MFNASVDDIFQHTEQKGLCLQTIFMCRIYNFSSPAGPSAVIDILELFIFRIPLASPKERPKLRVIIVAKATYWVIFCNFPRGIAIDESISSRSIPQENTYKYTKSDISCYEGDKMSLLILILFCFQHETLSHKCCVISNKSMGIV